MSRPRAGNIFITGLSISFQKFDNAIQLIRTFIHLHAKCCDNLTNPAEILIINLNHLIFY